MPAIVVSGKQYNKLKKDKQWIKRRADNPLLIGKISEKDKKLIKLLFS